MGQLGAETRASLHRPPRGVTITKAKAVSGPYLRPHGGGAHLLRCHGLLWVYANLWWSFFNSSAAGFDVIDADDNVAALQ